MDSVSIQSYQAGLAQDYQAYGGQRKRAQNPSEGSASKMSSATALATAEPLSRPQPAAEESLPQLTPANAWRLVGVVQAQALSSPPARLAELQPVASPQLVAATYA